MTHNAPPVRAGLQPLSGINVIEVASDSHGVAYCGRLLAGMGANVLRIVLPTDKADTTLPRLAGVRAAFLYEDDGKPSPFVPPDDDALASIAMNLLRASDVLIEGLPTTHPSRVHFDPDTLQGTRLIHVSITPFGRHGSWSEMRTTPFITGHAAGEASMNPTGLGALDQPPRVLPGHILEYDAGSVAASVIVAGLLEGDTGYRYCDLSVQDVGATLIRADIVTGLDTGVEVERSTRALDFGGIFRCADGWVSLTIRENRQWDALVALMGGPQWAEPYSSALRRGSDGFALNGLVAEWVRTRARDDLAARAQAAGIPLAPVRELPEVIAALGTTNGRAFGQQARTSRIRLPRSLPAIFSGFGSAAVARATQTPSGSLPLYGTRVVDVSTVWAAPCAAMFLAMLGADVIKVESSSRLDVTRRIDRDTTGVAFHLANSGKRSVVADLDLPSGRRTFTELVRTSDIVLTNAQPSLFARNGLGYDDLSQIAPHVVWVYVSTLGADDLSGTRGYGASFSALSGVSAVNGQVGRRPAEVGNAADFRVAYDTLLCSLAGLLLARRTGRGGLVDVSCTEAMTLRIGDLLARYQLDGNTCEVEDPSQLGSLAADGRWVACHVEDDGDRRALLRCIGSDAKDEGISDLLSQWTSQRAAADAVAALRECGLAATVSMSNVALGQLSHLRERRLIRAVERDRRVLPAELMGAPWHSPANRWEALTRGAERALEPGPRLGDDRSTGCFN